MGSLDRHHYLGKCLLDLFLGLESEPHAADIGLMRDIGRNHLQNGGEARLIRSLRGFVCIMGEEGKGDRNPSFVQDLLGLDLREKCPALAAGVIDNFSYGHAPTGDLVSRDPI